MILNTLHLTTSVSTKKILTLGLVFLLFGFFSVSAAHAADTDSDGYTDDQEAFLGTDPNDSDTDDDGLNDYVEAMLYTSPTEYDTITDDAYSSDYTLDNDADGLSNGYEVNDGVLGDVQVGNFTGEGGNPNNADTDEDGLGDLFEATYAGTCTDITIDNSDHDDTLDPLEDCDNDGLTNTQEEAAGTSPLLADTDEDGFSDADEVTAGSNPNNASETPETLTEEVVEETPPAEEVPTEEEVPAEDPVAEAPVEEAPAEEPVTEETVEEAPSAEEATEENSEDASESTSDHGEVTSVEGVVDGAVEVMYEDASSLRIEAFTTTRTPKAKLTPDAQYIVVLGPSGRRLKIYTTDGVLMDSKKIRTHAQKKVKLRVWDFYADGTNEIVVVTKRKQVLRTTALQLSSSGELHNKNSERYEPFTYKKFKVKKKKHSVRIRHNGETVVRYKVSSTAQLTLSE